MLCTHLDGKAERKIPERLGKGAAALEIQTLPNLSLNQLCYCPLRSSQAAWKQWPKLFMGDLTNPPVSVTQQLIYHLWHVENCFDLSAGQVKFSSSDGVF